MDSIGEFPADIAASEHRPQAASERTRSNDARTERSAAAGTRERSRSRSSPGARPNRAQLAISTAVPPDAPDWARAGRKREGKRARKEAGNPVSRSPMQHIRGGRTNTAYGARQGADCADRKAKPQRGPKESPLPPIKNQFPFGGLAKPIPRGKGGSASGMGGRGRARRNDSLWGGTYSAPIIVAVDCLKNRIVGVDVPRSFLVLQIAFRLVCGVGRCRPDTVVPATIDDAAEICRCWSGCPCRIIDRDRNQFRIHAVINDSLDPFGNGDRYSGPEYVVPIFADCAPIFGYARIRVPSSSSSSSCC